MVLNCSGRSISLSWVVEEEVIIVLLVVLIVVVVELK